MSESEILAREHWKFISKWLEIVYIDSFIHGFKHGVESTEGINRKDKMLRGI
jgi:hypothetical protein